MAKHERFVVIAKSRVRGGEVEEIAINAFDTYPSDDKLQLLWNQCSESRIVFYLKVEKQVRFD